MIRREAEKKEKYENGFPCDFDFLIFHFYVGNWQPNVMQWPVKWMEKMNDEEKSKG